MDISMYYIVHGLPYATKSHSAGKEEPKGSLHCTGSIFTYKYQYWTSTVTALFRVVQLFYIPKTKHLFKGFHFKSHMKFWAM
jgi:hypothetical protein